MMKMMQRRGGRWIRGHSQSYFFLHLRRSKWTC